MSFDYFSIMSNGVGSDGTPTDSEWAILGISYGFITDALSEAIPSNIISKILEIGKQGLRFAFGMLRTG
jgi:hypothetical protein